MKVRYTGILTGILVMLTLLYSCAVTGYAAMEYEIDRHAEQREHLSKINQYSDVAKNASVWGLVGE